MARRVFLHIGAPKSGTTYIQSLLWANRALLREHGLLIPGRRAFDHNRGALAVAAGRQARERPPRAFEIWERLVGEAREWPDDVVISHEWFVRATKEQAADTVAAFSPATVHVVFTARDFVQQIPAGWQETLKVGRGWSMDGFVRRLDSADNQWSWWTLDPAEVLDRWPVEASRVHLVTVPPSGREPGLLWTRFAQACGFDPAGSDVTVARPNQSLGVEAARWLQLVGPDLRRGISDDSANGLEHYRWIRNRVAHEQLVPLGGGRIGVDEALADLLRARAAESVARLRDRGYDIIGDLDELSAGRVSADSRRPEEVSLEELLPVARALTAALLGELREQTIRAEQAERLLHRRSSTGS